MSALIVGQSSRLGRSPAIIATTTLASFLRWKNGTLPVNISTTVMPKDHTSVALVLHWMLVPSSMSLSNSSGACQRIASVSIESGTMKCQVPVVFLIRDGRRMIESPKSVRLALPSSLISMLLALMSPWIIEILCRYDKASATCAISGSLLICGLFSR